MTKIKFLAYVLKGKKHLFYMLGRRDLLKYLGGLLIFFLSGSFFKNKKKPVKPRGFASEVYVMKTVDRVMGVRELMRYLDADVLKGKRIALKANYNSADSFPASTHIDTLSAIVDFLKEMDADIVFAERSGMGKTREVLEERGVIDLSRKEDFEVVVLDELESPDWIKIQPEGSHWEKGFLFPKILREADAVIQTCCLKTHRFRGHFTMSLKNSVGMIAKHDPEDGHNYMRELHSVWSQRKKIAETNTAYESEFLIMDAIQGFSDGGPDKGTLIEPGVMLASNDRIAMDAVGVAILRIYGTTKAVSKGLIFEQDQIARAVELGLGATRPEEIKVIPVNEQAKDFCDRIETELKKDIY
jgi:uncharacterized protein (DUF362 family)